MNDLRDLVQQPHEAGLSKLWSLVYETSEKEMRERQTQKN